MNKGWILVKPKFHDSYETIRLVEEFKNNNIGLARFYFFNIINL